MKLPSAHRDNFITALWRDLQTKASDEDVGPDKAFTLVVLDTLGFDVEQGFLTDGKGDHGLDYAHLSDTNAEVFQFKSHDYELKVDPDEKLEPKDLTDLPRLTELLVHMDSPPKDANREVKNALQKLSALVTRFRDRARTETEPFHITVYLASMASSFTAQAEKEFAALTKPVDFKHKDTPVHLTVRPLLMDAILEKRWLISNTDWLDADEHKHDKISLSVVGEHLLSEPNSLVFYTRAEELVQAYKCLGHQLFEPNVRCAIRHSKVNDEIRHSIELARGRKEFKHLNNGITMICDGFSKSGPHEKPKAINVLHPGIINGLQTVTAIAEGYDELPETEKVEFRDYCQVIVRLHTRTAVKDYRELVKSTNNQNPMQPRNLRSNNPEQICYEKLFATLGWFYERKQGAWHAFKSNPRLWASLQNHKATHFLVNGSRTYRVVDNDELGQCWLSFIGFSNEAVHERKRIFDDDKVYDLVFQCRTPKHGAAYDFKLDDSVFQEEQQVAPDCQLMLASYLLRHAAKKLVPAPKANRDQAIKRLKIEDCTREEIDKALYEDKEYRVNRILSAWSLLFPEFVGYILYRTFGDKVHSIGHRLFATPSFETLVRNRDFSSLSDGVRNGTHKPDDVLPVLWCLFEHVAHQLASEGTPWLRQWQNSPTRTRFNYSINSRRSLFEELNHLDTYVQQGEFIRPWAREINRHKGVYKYVEKVLS